MARDYRMVCTVTGETVGIVKNVRRSDRIKVYLAFRFISLRVIR